MAKNRAQPSHIMYFHWLRNFRHRLANTESLLHFSVLGILSGFTCAVIMLAFHYAISWPSSLWLPEGNAENFEALPNWLKFTLPLGGAIVIGLILKWLPEPYTRTGVPHVITRLHGHNGHLPTGNVLVQFFLGAFAIGTGQSGGREGPSIHLGAGINSVIGQKLLLPNNSIRVLVGCGTAAAIAAAFNTPIAGVIFAMEVVMMEYTIAGFIPVMLAAFTATVFSRNFGIDDAIAFSPVTQLTSLWELPYVALLGLVVGSCASMFVIVLKIGGHQSHRPIARRMLVAGLVTGGCALLVPEIMGLGYDSLNSALAGEFSLHLLLALAVTKLIATAISCGLGMPVGLIGPNLLIGACIGSAMGTLGTYFFPELTTHHSFYAILGMGAMMGAVLNAPLAALMAVVELTESTLIIFPAMLAITVATLTNKELFKQLSATQTALMQQQEKIRTDPLSLALQRTGVASVMNRDIKFIAQCMSKEQANDLLQHSANTLVIKDKAQHIYILNWAPFKPFLETALAEINNHEFTTIDLLNINGHAQQVVSLHIQATLREALDAMDEHQVDAIFISGYTPGHNHLPDHGVLTRHDINHHASLPL